MIHVLVGLYQKTKNKMKKLMPRISKLEKKLEDPLYIPSKGKEKGE